MTMYAPIVVVHHFDHAERGNFYFYASDRVPACSASSNGHPGLYYGVSDYTPAWQANAYTYTVVREPGSPFNRWLAIRVHNPYAGETVHAYGWC